MGSLRVIDLWNSVKNLCKVSHSSTQRNASTLKVWAARGGVAPPTGGAMRYLILLVVSETTHGRLEREEPQVIWLKGRGIYLIRAWPTFLQDYLHENHQKKKCIRAPFVYQSPMKRMVFTLFPGNNRSLNFLEGSPAWNFLEEVQPEKENTIIKDLWRASLMEIPFLINFNVESKNH